MSFGVEAEGSHPKGLQMLSFQDIAGGLEKVGTAAFGLIPQGLKDALNPEARMRTLSSLRIPR
jgi:hypothetical protein